MPQPSKPLIPPAAEPVYGKNFDTWNSVSTGHQRAEMTGPQGWRDSRNRKLQSQFVSGHSGGKRLFDTVGAGSPDYDDKSKTFIPGELRARTMNSVADMLKRPSTMHQPDSRKETTPSALPPGKGNVTAQGSSTANYMPVEGEMLMAKRKGEDGATEARRGQGRKLLDGLTIYVNGSTHPIVSDHKLKHLLAENGARTSLHLGRRQVTHVIVGRPAGATGGAGGGLAGGKLDKEIKRVGGCGIKFVGVEWVLESIKAGKRLSEARFAPLKVASKSQQSVLGVFSKASETQQPGRG
ncbi:BRCA1 C terminus domain-containing protein [Thozetella sp. PMI_491]|nr:BRCA1 C terminus domain-containing protein [Thozetella sp. PMI_491]